MVVRKKLIMEASIGIEELINLLHIDKHDLISLSIESS